MTSVERQLVWVGTSWKMTKTLGEARAFVEAVSSLQPLPGIQPFVLPAHTALASVRDWLPASSPILLGAQNAHWGPEGAGTGEVSMRMAKDAGARIVEVGHSERRAAFGETDATVAAKVAAALEHGLVPLVCVGEPGRLRARARAEAFVSAQVRAALSGVPAGRVSEVLVAYEPVWAIGSAGRPATAEEIGPVLRAVAATVEEVSGGVPARALLYGGGVDETSAGEILGDQQVQGLFVGRAGWEAAGFLRMLELVVHHLSTSGDRPVRHG